MVDLQPLVLIVMEVTEGGSERVGAALAMKGAAMATEQLVIRVDKGAMEERREEVAKLERIKSQKRAMWSRSGQ